jgi:hypothetical protein
MVYVLSDNKLKKLQLKASPGRFNPGIAAYQDSS